MKSDILKILGTKIKEARLKKGWTIEQLAEAVNLSTNFLGLVERSKKSLSIESLCKIADSLEITIDSLLKEFIDSTENKINTLRIFIEDLNDEEFDFIIETIKSVKSHFRKNDQ